MAKTPKDIDAYIRTFPKEVQGKLRELRETIKKAAPGAVEAISYQIPTFKLDGKYLIYFAAWKNHISLYPANGTMQTEFKKELVPYKLSKGTIKFPLNEPLPMGLIKKIVKFRIKLVKELI